MHPYPVILYRFLFIIVSRLSSPNPAGGLLSSDEGLSLCMGQAGAIRL